MKKTYMKPFVNGFETEIETLLAGSMSQTSDTEAPEGTENEPGNLSRDNWSDADWDDEF